MGTPSIYINLDDDVSKIVVRLKHTSAKQVVLVCPKRSLLFSDSINLRLLKKQADLMGKDVSILTMDEKGQLYAKEAGFSLKFMPKSGGRSAISDVKFAKRDAPKEPPAAAAAETGVLAASLEQVKNFAHSLTPSKILGSGPAEVPAKKPVQAMPPQTPVKISDTVFPAETRAHGLKLRQKNYLNKVITGIVAVSLILVLLLVFVILPKATVVVYPKTEPVTRDMEINMSVNAGGVDPDKLIVPAQLINQSINVSDKFQSQGKQQVGNAASGTVKIYNFTGQPLTLRASTTILSVAGQNYMLADDVIALKPTTYSNSRTKEVNPASLGDSVDVVAAQGGDNYNLPAGTRLEISNKVFGSRPQVLYAVTDTEITGGTTRYLSVISQDDVNAAKTQLENEAITQERQTLQNSGGVLADKLYTIQITQFTTDNPAGAQTPSFTATLQAQITGLAYKKQDLMDLINKRIGETLASNKTLEPITDSQVTTSAKSLDLTNQLAVLDVNFQGTAVFDLDLPDISPQLVGKSENQVNEILLSKAEIDKVVITLAPAWQKNFPYFASKIKVQIAPPTN